MPQCSCRYDVPSASPLCLTTWLSGPRRQKQTRRKAGAQKALAYGVFSFLPLATNTSATKWRSPRPRLAPLRMRGHMEHSHSHRVHACEWANHTMWDRHEPSLLTPVPVSDAQNHEQTKQSRLKPLHFGWFVMAAIATSCTHQKLHINSLIPFNTQPALTFPRLSRGLFLDSIFIRIQ